MAFNGSGTFNRIYNWVNDRNAGLDITASRFDTEMDGMATGLSNALCKDGQQTATANQPMGGYKHTNIANATAVTHYAAAGQVQDGSLIYCGTSSGTDAITAATSPALTAYAAGNKFWFKAGGTNTGAATLNISSVGAKSIKKGGSSALVAGDITTGDIVVVVYDGTNMQMVSTLRTPVITNGAITNAMLASASVGASKLVTTIIHDLTAKTSLTGADEIAISDSAASDAAKKITWTNLKAQLATDRPAQTRQYLTSGSAATYTTPAGCAKIVVKAWGAGGGGGASATNSGAAGGNTIFNSINAVGGGGGATAASGAGGYLTTPGTGSATFRVIGSAGGNGQFGGGDGGGNGGSTMLGGAGLGGNTASAAGKNAQVNSGSGGGGAVASGSNWAGGGGQAGEYFELVISSPSATYTYTIGAAGAGGAAGTNVGGNGGTGMIIVEEYY